MSAMFAGIAFTVVFSIPALVREIRLARRFDSPASGSRSRRAVGIASASPRPKSATSTWPAADSTALAGFEGIEQRRLFDLAAALGDNLFAEAVIAPFLVDIVP